jgi:hypothetical protein
MFIVLYCKYDDEGSERQNRCPEPEISFPYIRIGFDLEGGLKRGRKDEGNYHSLQTCQ